MKKQTFLLPQKIVIFPFSSQIVRKDLIKDPNSVIYYSDCVFHPYVHKFDQGECQIIDNEKIIIDFSFVLQAIVNNPKILDNIGVLKIGKIARYGVLITKQKEGIFLSLID